MSLDLFLALLFDFAQECKRISVGNLMSHYFPSCSYLSVLILITDLCLIVYYLHRFIIWASLGLIFVIIYFQDNYGAFLGLEINLGLKRAAVLFVGQFYFILFWGLFCNWIASDFHGPKSDFSLGFL